MRSLRCWSNALLECELQLYIGSPSIFLAFLPPFPYRYKPRRPAPWYF